jgi:hypothetical protein
MTDKDQKMLESALWHISNSVTNGKSQTTECEITKWLKEKFNSLPAEQQSNSLDNFIQSLLETYPTNKNEVPKEALNDYHQGLICGARKTYNWILESAIKIDAKIVNDETSGCVVDCEQGCLVLEPHRYPIGQKLKILILEDEQCITE